jgi:hypothetical protein
MGQYTADYFATYTITHENKYINSNYGVLCDTARRGFIGAPSPQSDTRP